MEQLNKFKAKAMLREQQYNNQLYSNINSVMQHAYIPEDKRGFIEVERDSDGRK